MGGFYRGCADQLILHVRHLAWLNAAPRKSEKSERKAEPVSRLLSFQNKAKMGAEVPQLELPPLGLGGHLVEHLFAIGPSTGGEAITYQEIRAWQALTGVPLDAWEAETLRTLSGAYLSELHAAEQPDRPPPYTPEEPEPAP